MRYILDVSGRDLELIKASIVNFERSLEMSSQGDFEHLIEELNDTYLSLKRQKRKQLNSKLRRKWGSIMKCLYKELDRRKKYLIAKLQNEIATLEWQWFQREIQIKNIVYNLMILKDV